MNTQSLGRPFQSLTLAKLAVSTNQLLAIVSIGSLLVVWEVLSHFISPFLLPSPWKVFGEAVHMAQNGELARNTLASLSRILFGFVLGCAAGIPIGLLIGRLELARGLILPILDLIRPISPVALVPLIIVWFGIGEAAKIILVGYTTFIVMVFNTMAGAAATPISRERAARCLGATEMEVFRYVIVPSAVPFVVTGMRIGLGFCFMSVVAAELIAAESGIGFLIMQSRFSMLTERMFVGLAMLGILGLTSDWLLRKLTQRFGRSYLGSELKRVI
jgi:ABC-type nitrate/sulfonate/bicarbonate transport system permease component